MQCFKPFWALRFKLIIHRLQQSGLAVLWRYNIKLGCVVHEKEKGRDRSVQMVTQLVLWLLALWDYFLFGEGSGTQMASYAALLFLFFLFYLNLLKELSGLY